MERLTYLLRRLGYALLTLIGVGILLFFLIRLMPGSAARAMLGVTATPEQIAAFEHTLGLDRPVVVQLADYIGGLFSGDLGTSLLYRKPVSDVIAGALPVTIQLTVYVLVLSIITTVTLAWIAAANRGGAVDQMIRAIPLIGIGMPSFWIGAMLLFIFALTLRWFPVGGYVSEFPGNLVTLFLPALTITIAVSAILIRSLRLGLIGVLESDHVLTARAKGMSGFRLMISHVLPNAAIPTITVLTLVFASLIGGALVVEQVFALPGLGSLVIAGFRAHDLPLVMGIALITAAFVLVANVVADLAYVLIDPRVALR